MGPTRGLRLCLSLLLLGAASTAAAQLMTWVATGSMGTARYDHVAVLLNNGKVLVAGGSNLGLVNTGEIFDPATRQWTSVSNTMVSSRFQPAAAAIRNDASGRVLITGGTGGSPLRTVDVYTPGTNAFSAGTSMITSRQAHTATSLLDGRILVIGGWSGGPFSNNGEVFDPSSDTWTSTPAFASGPGRDSHVAVLLTSGPVAGDVLMAGGGTGVEAYATANIYRSSTNTWTVIASLNQARTRAGGAFLSNGQVLVAGGFYPGNAAFSSCELYDTGANLWTYTGSLSAQRSYINFQTVTLANGLVLVAGGPNSAQTNSETFDAASGTWTTVARSMPTGHFSGTLTLLSDGMQAICAGGYQIVNGADLWTYAPTPTPTSTQSATASHTQSATASFTKSATASYTQSFTQSATATATASATASYTQTATQSDTASFTQSDTASFTKSATASYTQSFTQSDTASFTQSDTASSTQTDTASFTQSDTASFTQSATASFTQSATQSATASATQSATASFTQSATASHTQSATATATPTPRVSTVLYYRNPTWFANASIVFVRLLTFSPSGAFLARTQLNKCSSTILDGSWVTSISALGSLDEVDNNQFVVAAYDASVPPRNIANDTGVCGDPDSRYSGITFTQLANLLVSDGCGGTITRAYAGEYTSNPASCTSGSLASSGTTFFMYRNAEWAAGTSGTNKVASVAIQTTLNAAVIQTQLLPCAAGSGLYYSLVNAFQGPAATFQLIGWSSPNLQGNKSVDVLTCDDRDEYPVSVVNWPAAHNLLSGSSRLSGTTYCGGSVGQPTPQDLLDCGQIQLPTTTVHYRNLLWAADSSVAVVVLLLSSYGMQETTSRTMTLNGGTCWTVTTPAASADFAAQKYTFAAFDSAGLVVARDLANCTQASSYVSDFSRSTIVVDSPSGCAGTLSFDTAANLDCQSAVTCPTNCVDCFAASNSNRSATICSACGQGFGISANQTACIALEQQRSPLGALPAWLTVVIYGGFAVLVVGAYFVLRKRAPTALNMRFVSAALSVFDLVIDTLFVISISSEPTVAPAFYISVVLLVVPVLTNLIVLTLTINREIARSKVFGQWLRENAAVVAAVTVLAGKSAENLLLVESKILGLRVFSAEVTPQLHASVRTLAFVSTFFEALPQLGVQVYIAIVLGFDAITTMSIISGVIMLLMSVMRRLMLLLITRHEARDTLSGDGNSNSKTVMHEMAETKSASLDLSASTSIMIESFANKPSLDVY